MSAPLAVGGWRDTPGAAWPQQCAEVRRDGALVGHLVRMRHASGVEVRRADGTPMFSSPVRPKTTAEWVAAVIFPNVDAALIALEKSLG